MYKIGFAAAAFSLFAAPATAHSPTILASHAPRYKAGDHFIGSLRLLGSEIRLKIVQYALPEKNGKTYVHTDIVFPDGRVLVRAMRDPVTGRETVRSDRSTFTILKTTCTGRRIFPFYVGKHFDCSEILFGEGRLIVHSYRYSYIYTKHDRDGRITSLCRTKREVGKKKIVDICSTPDGKWIESMTELPSLPI